MKVAKQRDEFVKTEFSTPADLKDDYNLNDIQDPEAWLVIGFLNPIFHLLKPKRIISKWVATFLQAMRKRITVD